ELDSVVLRGEFVYTQNKYLSTSNLLSPDGLARKNIIEYLLAAEHTFSNDVDVNLQASQQIIPAYENDLVGETHTRTSLSLGVQRSFFNDRVQPALQGVTDWPYHDFIARPSLGFRFGNHWRLTVGA